MIEVTINFNLVSDWLRRQHQFNFSLIFVSRNQWLKNNGFPEFRMQRQHGVFSRNRKITFKIDCKSTDLLKPFNFRPKSLCSHFLFYFSSANHNQFKAGTNDRDR